MGRRIIMNVCILFILLNGSTWATDGCWSPNGYMMEPQDVVYTQRLPYTYSTQVWAPPQYWVNDWRPWARSYRNWDGYRFSRQQNRRWIRHRRWLSQRQGRNWNRGYRQGRRDARRWNNGYRQGRRDAKRWNRGYRQGRRDANARRVNRRSERRMNKNSRNGNRRGKKNKNKRRNRR